MTRSEFEAAIERVRALKAQADEVGLLYDEAVRAAHAEHRALTAERKERLAPIEDEDRDLRAAISAYHAEHRTDSDYAVPDGVTWREDLDVAEVDVLEVCRAIVEGRLDPSFVTVDRRACRDEAVALGDLADVPGVTFGRRWVPTIKRGGE